MWYLLESSNKMLYASVFDAFYFSALDVRVGYTVAASEGRTKLGGLAQ